MLRVLGCTKLQSKERGASLEKYIVKLNSVYSEEVALQLKNENIFVHHQAKLMPNLLIIETDVSYEKLLLNGLFKSVEKNHIGRIDI